MAKGKAAGGVDVEDVIRRAVDAGLRAGRVIEGARPNDTYRQTEKRLRAHRVLIKKNMEDKERLAELLAGDVRERSRSLVRFSKPGWRITEEEKVDALVAYWRAIIAKDEYEIETIRKALETIQDDSYFWAVRGRYLDKWTDEEIAEHIQCDPSTVRRNRGRLVRELALWLYGAEAI